MSIPAIGPISLATPSITPSADTSASSGAGFASQLGKGLERVQAAQDKADDLAVKAATGSLSDVHDFVIASTEASIATQLTAAIRNKALEAFAEIMRMQA